MSDQFCYFCMTPSEADCCPHCGKSNNQYTPPPHVLPPGTVLCGKYMIGAVLGEGGFGITYIARDINLDMLIAVKEYFPKGNVSRSSASSLDVIPGGGNLSETFEKGKQSFLTEARVLSKFCDEPNIVNIRDFFTENNTSYIVTSFISGITLEKYVAENGLMSFSRVFELLSPIMIVLGKVHAQGLIHRDISPTNIMLKDNGTAALIDFGTARDFSQNSNATYSVMLKVGYSPEEQYRSKGEQGPWTDVYSLSASAYYLMTGKVPLDSISRLFEDTLESIPSINPLVTPEQEAVIKKGMAVDHRSRYQSMEEMYAAFAACASGNTSQQPVSIAKAVEPSAPISLAKEPEQSAPVSISKSPEQSAPVSISKSPEQSAPVSVSKSPEQSAPVSAAESPEQNGDSKISQKKPNKIGLIGSIILGAASLFSLMSSGVMLDDSDETSTIVGLFVAALLLGTGAVFAGRTYFLRTNYKQKKPNPVFAVFTALPIIAAVALVVLLTINYDTDYVRSWLAIAIDLVIVAVFFGWLFYRRLQLKGKKIFKTVCAAGCGAGVFAVVIAMTIHSLTTVMIGDEQVDLSAESLSIYGDLVTNRDMERLKRLKKLKSLTINACFLDDEDVNFISELTWLERLNISNNTDITDISPLASITQLKSLDVYNTHISDISSLTSLSSLEELDISKTDVTDLSCLSHFEKLTSLNISKTKSLDVSTIVIPSTLQFFYANKCGLTSLDFITPAKDKLLYIKTESNSISDLTPLKECSSLVNIDLRGNRISDISPLSELSLMELDIAGNDVRDISALSNMSNLFNLDVSFNKIEDISPLEKDDKLGLLNLSNNNISDISALKDCFRISNLDISFNRISDITALATIDKLDDLNMKHNNIKDITPLASCTKLLSSGYMRSIGYNEIRDISPLKGYKGKYIEMDHNKISDISVVSSFTNLENINLDNNEITDSAPLALCLNLRNLSMNFNKVTQINQLFSLPNLWSVSAVENNITNVAGLDSILAAAPSSRRLSLTYREGLDVKMLAECSNLYVTLYDIDERQKDSLGFKVYYSTAEKLKAEQEAELKEEMTFKVDFLEDDDESTETADDASVEDAA